jgi:hypothetical protein
MLRLIDEAIYPSSHYGWILPAPSTPATMVGDMRTPTTYRSSAANNSATPYNRAATVNSATIVGASAAIFIVRVTRATAGIVTTTYDRAPSNDRSTAIGRSTSINRAAAVNRPASVAAAASARGPDLYKLTVISAKAFRDGDRRAHGRQDSQRQTREARKGQLQTQIAQVSYHDYLPGNCERGLSRSDNRDLAACYRRAGDRDTG